MKFHPGTAQNKSRITEFMESTLNYRLREISKNNLSPTNVLKSYPRMADTYNGGLVNIFYRFLKNNSN